MGKKLVLSIWIVVFLLAGCADNGTSALKATANAVEEKDYARFQEIVDLDSLTGILYEEAVKARHATTLPDFQEAANEANLADVVRRIAGQAIQTEFKREITFGTLPASCAKMENWGCPWEPQALRSGAIVKLNSSARVAAVDSSKGVRTWLILRQRDKDWKIVGILPTLEKAKFYAEKTETKN